MTIVKLITSHKHINFDSVCLKNIDLIHVDMISTLVSG